MSLHPDFGADERRGAILSASPLLRTFIVRDFTDEKWVPQLESELKPIEETFEDILGPKWRQNTAIPLLLTLQTLGTFNLSLPLEEQLGALSTILGIGFQIGSYEDCSEFVPDICARLDDISVLNSKIHTDENLRHKIFQSVMGVLASGSWVRQLSADKPTAFSDFINGLDINNKI